MVSQQKKSINFVSKDAARQDVHRSERNRVTNSRWKDFVQGLVPSA